MARGPVRHQHKQSFHALEPKLESLCDDRESIIITIIIAIQLWSCLQQITKSELCLCMLVSLFHAPPCKWFRMREMTSSLLHDSKVGEIQVPCVRMHIQHPISNLFTTSQPTNHRWWCIHTHIIGVAKTVYQRDNSVMLTARKPCKLIICCNTPCCSLPNFAKNSLFGLIRLGCFVIKRLPYRPWRHHWTTRCARLDDRLRCMWRRRRRTEELQRASAASWRWTPAKHH